MVVKSYEQMTDVSIMEVKTYLLILFYFLLCYNSKKESEIPYDRIT